MEAQGLYDPRLEHDACGVGFVANIKGQQTHQIVSEGIGILKNLIHRGAVGGDEKTGDGAGILIQTPHDFFAAVAAEAGITLPAAGAYGVGMLFVPRDKEKRKRVLALAAEAVKDEGLKFLGSRDVPVDPSCLGAMALASRPDVVQAFIELPGLAGSELERRLYVLRRVVENRAQAAGFGIESFYVSSLSSRTVVYKGLFVAPQLETFYPDLKDPRLVSAFALVHQRYSTNTFPSWPLAQPFRALAHNGEINTLRGNVNKMNARESTLRSEAFGADIAKLLPVIEPSLSDSGQLDNVFELLSMSGRGLEHAMMMLIPEAFGTKYHISQDKRAFYEYHAALMEPWDGPAAVSFTDGVKIAAILDRNGLRPARYTVTRSGKFVLASETGVLDIPPEDILQKGRLAPGKMILVDTAAGRVVYDNEIKATVSRRMPYRRWLDANRIELKGLFQSPEPVSVERESLATRQKMFGYTLEDITMILAPMAANAQEPVGSMGNDAALAVLEEKPVLLHQYFKQLFAQVTNPPIDPYRENLVMSLMSFIGREGNLMEETPLHCRQLKLPYPVLTNEDMRKLSLASAPDLKSVVLPMFLPAGDSPLSVADCANDAVCETAGRALEAALDRLVKSAEEKVDAGANIVVLSDRGADERNVGIPALLAVSAVHHHLTRRGKRHLCGLVVESGETKDVMQFATLSAFGASAVNPYLAFETLVDLKEHDQLPADLTIEAAFENYITAVKKGLLKVMSKMGVSTIRSYKGAQLFEAVGIDSSVIEKYFPGTNSRIGGVGLGVIAGEALLRHRRAVNDARDNRDSLPSGGDIHYRAGGYKHILTPLSIRLLQHAVRSGDYGLFKQYSARIDDASKNLCTIRGLLAFKKGTPAPIEEVEPVDSIVKRFYTGAMSFGSLSKEAHETIAAAMNRLGGRSNSGEGGEDEARYTREPGADDLTSRVKQVASARFGVTSNYLVHAEELQIKMAQGAKPGEGGQLPGHKVDEIIAKVRHSTPGVMLISPPPHHDIYSIEDLAQLIFDLKNANPAARVSVKLVAEVGVGTVAAGVAKGKADMVLISGHDGGTGASPISSIKHAGIPWEIGLAETQQTLVKNRLRDKIRVQADGKMKTGRDVVTAALLGAEEIGFGTLTLISLGCIMVRKCHLNTCPVGITTQDPRLRKLFPGKPEHLINFMRFTAQETRELMASLGFRTFDEMVGRVDMLDVRPAVAHWKAKGVDLSRLLVAAAPEEPAAPAAGSGGRKPGSPAEPAPAARRCLRTVPIDLSHTIDAELIANARQALERKTPVRLFAPIRNSNRTVGATLSREISLRYGSAGLPPETITCRFTGSAGQSFGAFLARGISFEIEGDANDYFGKGLSGGRLVIYPPRLAAFRAEHNIIVGNVSLFGATSGEAYIRGMAGERFAVRNSGATAVVEGVGDHACEYMTGGTVVVLGRTGLNFAAGMSGGVAYVLDANQLFDTHCNLEMVDVEPVREEAEQGRLKDLIQEHVRLTGSEYAAHILRDWAEVAMQFVRVMPIDYRRALERLKKLEAEAAEHVTVTEEVYTQEVLR
ncbi:MAG: glutamate synthase large subunit [Spirochaetales bacterium]|nr:glutamate synthase large subunit [Spirochaetales bacterium]